MPAKTPEGWRGLALAYRGQGNSEARCAELAGVSISTIKRLRNSDEDFADDWNAATEVMRDSLRDELWARGFDRNDKESARILLWLGEHYLPEGRTRGELALTGAEGGPIRVAQGVSTLAEVRALLESQGAFKASSIVGGEGETGIEPGTASRRALPAAPSAVAESR